MCELSKILLYDFLCILEGIPVSRHSRKGCKLSCTAPHRHLRMTLRDVMRQVNNIVVISHNISIL